MIANLGQLKSLTSNNTETECRRPGHLQTQFQNEPKLLYYGTFLRKI